MIFRVCFWVLGKLFPFESLLAFVLIEHELSQKTKESFFSLCTSNVDVSLSSGWETTRASGSFIMMSK